MSNAAWAEDFDFSGPPPICPRWAFEPWVWEDDINTRDSLMDLVDTYEEHEIPVGAVIIDSPWEAGQNSARQSVFSEYEVGDTANAADWSLRNDLQPGDQQYGDRTYAFTSVPEMVVGAQWIRTANDSKAYAGPVVSFTLLCDAVVYIAHDQRVVDKPDWLPGSPWMNIFITMNSRRRYSDCSKSIFSRAISSNWVPIRPMEL